MKKLGLTLLASAAAVGLVLHFNAGEAKSRPQYAKAFAAKYAGKPAEEMNADEKAFAEMVTKAKCLVCHEAGNDKKKRNDYGKALAVVITPENATGFKGETDVKKINEALDKVAAIHTNPKEEKSPTYGDLIKKGKLPVELKADDKKGDKAEEKK